MKKILLSLFVICGLAASALLVYAAYTFNSSSPLHAEKIILIPKGAGVKGMSDQLQAEHIITNKWVFIAFAKATGTYKTLQAGEYQFAPGITMNAVLAKIARGDIYERRFTIPEGKTSYEIVQILNAVPNLTGEIAQTPAEGTLLPDTYAYQSDDTRASKIALMQAAMTKTIDELWPQRDQNLPFTTKEEAITLASIVEKETGVASERKTVAGVFINRLRIGMMLQTDPTVIYGLTKGEHKNDGQGPLGRRLLKKDLEAPNPYNTYKIPGLPPGPIANPGRASIEAVLHPEANNFLFFVADGKGGHVFASTLDEHNRNVNAWRAIRNAQ